jgi:DNA-binding protein HU-beta
VNKAELIEALAARLGDRKAATSALDAVLAEVQAAVTKGDRVAITGFGVFEKRVRGARTARNPRTGESVKVKKTSVPAFRPGAGFKEMVASGKAPKNTVAAKKSATATTAKSTVAKKTATKKAAPAKATATKAAAGKKTAPAKKATGVKKATTAKKTTAAKKSTAAKSTSTRATAAKKTTAKKAPAKKAAKR